MTTTLLNSDLYTRGDHFLDMFRVHQLPCPEMCVHVNQGTVIHDGRIINVDAQDSDPINAPRLGTWICVLSVDVHGRLVYSYGVQSVGSPVFPRLPDECMHLAAIRVSATTTQITDDEVFDLRQVFGFSTSGAGQGRCVCPAAASMPSDEEWARFKAAMDEVAELRLQVEQLRLLHQPQRTLTMISEGGLTYVLTLGDDGQWRATRVEDDFVNDEPVDDAGPLGYRFCMAGTQLNIVVGDAEDFVPFAVHVRAVDAASADCVATLRLASPGVQFFSECFSPQYREDEFILRDQPLTRAGLHQTFALNLRTPGDHVLTMTLLDQATGAVIDQVTALLRVTFALGNHMLDGHLCADSCTCHD